MNLDKLTALVDSARAEGRDVLLPHEGFQILEALEVATPRHLFVRDVRESAEIDLAQFQGDRIVVKAVAPDIPHKTEVGGVVFVEKDRRAIAEAIDEMAQALSKRDLRGFLVTEFVPYDRAPGGELLLGVRWTQDFGPVVTLGPGGIHTEFLADSFRPGSEIAIASPFALDAGSVIEIIADTAVTGLITGQLRQQPPRLELALLVDMFLKFAKLARGAVPDWLSELEVNPFVVSEGQLIALDVLARCELRRDVETAPRPIHKLGSLLEPHSIAILGVSERLNPGHVILNNILRAGFDPDRIYVLKPDSDFIEGCRCYADISAIPDTADLLILAVAAPQVPESLAAVIQDQKAESVIVISGGMEEKAGTEEFSARIQTLLQEARSTDWGGPVLAGANSMGVLSRPGRYDATFLPDYKIRLTSTPTLPLAFISQSGAYQAAKTSRLGFDVRYAISVGNQTDLTVGDYLTYLKDDPEIEIFAVYAEGFRPGDGLHFLKAAREIVAGGRTVILYRAGRTREGAAASASHTASIAGDYKVTRALAAHAGVVVCDTTDDFDDMLKLFALLPYKKLAGLRLGAVSNAGFECVAVADHLGSLRLTAFSEETNKRLSSLLEEGGVDRIVDIRNPLDITPMIGDAAFEEAVRLVLRDEHVDVGFVGCVPLTPVLQTLAPGNLHEEDVFSDESIGMRLVRLKQEVETPWVASVEGGAPYDPLVRLLERHGVPVFRNADRALRLLSRFCRAALRAR